MTTIQRVCNTAANLNLLVSSLETDMTCPRCLQVLRQPQIIAPCGTTVCRSCVLANDDQRYDEIDAGFTFKARQDCGCQIHEGTAVNRGLDTMLNLWPEMKSTSTKLAIALNEITSALNREGVTKENVTSENLKKVKDKAEKSMMNMSSSEVESFAHQYNPFANNSVHHQQQQHFSGSRIHHNHHHNNNNQMMGSFHGSSSQQSSPAGSFSSARQSFRNNNSNKNFGSSTSRKRRSVSPGNVM